MQRAAKKHIKWPSFEEVRKFRWGDWSHDIAMGKLTLPQKVSIQQGSFGSGYDTIVDLVWRDAEGVANHLMDKKHTRHYYRWHSEVVKELKYYRKYLRAVMGYWAQQKESGAMFVQTVTLARRYVSLVELVDQTERCVSIAHIGVVRQSEEDEEERQDNKQRKKEERKSKNGNKRKSEFSKYCEEDPEPVKRQKTVVSVEIPPVSPSILAQFDELPANVPEDDYDGDDDFGDDQ